MNIQIPREHAPEQVEEVIRGTPDGQWALIYGVVDGQITKIHIRPDLYGMFFLHQVAHPTPGPGPTPGDST